MVHSFSFWKVKAFGRTNFIISTGCPSEHPVQRGRSLRQAFYENIILLPAGTLTGTAAVCSGGTSALSNDTTGGAWSSSATGIATVGSGGLVTGVASVTATISYTVANGCGIAVATRVVTVNALPSAGSITGTATVCTGSTTTLSNTITGGTWSSSATSISTVGNPVVVTGVAPGTATISYTVTNSCATESTTRVVTVNVIPSAGTITGTDTVTAGTLFFYCF